MGGDAVGWIIGCIGLVIAVLVIAWLLWRE